MCSVLNGAFAFVIVIPQTGSITSSFWSIGAILSEWLLHALEPARLVDSMPSNPVIMLVQPQHATRKRSMGSHTRHEGYDEHDGHGKHEGRDSHDRHAGHSVEMFRDKFWGSIVLTIPTVVW